MGPVGGRVFDHTGGSIAGSVSERVRELVWPPECSMRRGEMEC